MKTPPNNGRRAMLKLGGAVLGAGMAPIALGAGSAAAGDAHYLQQVGVALGMPAGASGVSRKIRSAVAPDALAAIVAHTAASVRGVVGKLLDTASHSVPSLIDDDYAAGRTLELKGLVFSHTELALITCI